MSYEPPPSTVVVEPETTNMKRALIGGGLLLVAGVVLAALGGPAVALVVVLVAAGVASAVFRDQVQAFRRWHAPRLEVASGGLELGARTAVTYRRSPRRPVDVPDCSLEGRLYCKETVTYDRGTDTVTDDRTVFEQRVSASAYGTADGVESVIEIEIPTHVGGPTLALRHNQVQWFLGVEVQGPRVARDTHDFELRVVPEIDSRLRPRLQDS